MAGKSTYMRQIALIVLMAQKAVLTPSRAEIGVVDKISPRGVHPFVVRTALMVR